MITPLPQRLTRSKSATIILSLALVVGLGVLDYFSGREVVISPFYLIPICWAGWFAGRRAGLWLAAASTAAWLVADVMSGYTYPHRAIPYWNAVMLLVLFTVVVYLLTAFHAAHLHLEETVAQRTAALRAEMAERKRLEMAMIQTERLAVMGTMAAEVAHEVRNPLGSIALNLDLIQKEIMKLAETSRYAPEEGRLLVNEMRAEVGRIQLLLEDYLQFSRLPKPQRRPVVLNEWLDQKLALMDGTFTEAKVKLRTHFDPALKTVSADAEQLWQAALNLIRNSLDAMPDGGEIIVRTWREDSEARLRVADTGSGMTPEQLKQVFTPFFSTKPSGTGLGLAIVQQIITEHGGHVECESLPGKGSTFTLFLPLKGNS